MKQIYRMSLAAIPLIFMAVLIDSRSSGQTLKGPTGLIQGDVLMKSSDVSGKDASQQPPKAADIDSQVRQFLDAHRGAWHDLNVPEADARELYRIVLAHGYKSALEIGTSTGHSGIWIAWALSKTGGKLITIDIDRDRNLQALANFKAAGVGTYIDARLGDAHEIVPTLQGPFDFVFSDADKEWYVNYAKTVLPRLVSGGCLVTHNVSDRGWGSNAGYLQFLRSLPSLETTLFTAGGGMSVSYKK